MIRFYNPDGNLIEAGTQSIIDLQDTLRSQRDRCVGMTANMIGYKKNRIIVSMGFADVVMVNSVIKKKNGSYQTEEGCLSLAEVRPTTRYREIEVEYQESGLERGFHFSFAYFPFM